MYMDMLATSRGNVSFQLSQEFGTRCSSSSTHSNDDNFDFIMCTNYKKLFCLFHYISSFVFYPSCTYCILCALHQVYCNIFCHFFGRRDGLLHFTIISRAMKKQRMPYRHETTMPLSMKIFSISISFYLFTAHHLSRSPSCSRTIFALSFKCSFSSIHSIAHTHTHTNCSKHA